MVQMRQFSFHFGMQFSNQRQFIFQRARVSVDSLDEGFFNGADGVAGCRGGGRGRSARLMVVGHEPRGTLESRGGGQGRYIQRRVGEALRSWTDGGCGGS